MNKTQVLMKLNKTWKELHSSYNGLTEAQLTEPGVTGDWSVKDILAHINAWEEEALKYLPWIILGKRLPQYRKLYGGIDAFNAQMTASMSSLSLQVVLNRLEETHQRLLVYLQSIGDEQFSTGSRFLHRLRMDTYSHYPIHAKAIREWREKQ